MNDNNKKVGDQEETYQFPEDEYMSSASHDAAVSNNESETPYHYDDSDNSDGTGILNKVKSIKNIRPLVAVGVAIVVLITFSIMHHKSQPKIVERAPVQTMAQSPDLKVETALNNLRQDQEDHQGVVSSLQSQVAELKSSLSSSNKQQVLLTQEVSTMASGMRDLTQQLVAIQAKLKPKNIVKKKVGHPIHLVHYVVKAVVPGRVWLIGSDNSEVTLSLGNELKGYGVIKSINADSGTVLTSSGKVISYGNNDN